MATIILKNLVTGETSGGVFTLTSITNGNYPTTIYDVNLASNVTFNSAADLPYSFTAGVPYDAIVTTLSTTKAGTYNFEYCVSNCGTIQCSTSSVTMVEKPVMGTTPTINRCGVNGVYGSVTACYLGGITKTSDGTAYTDPLTPLSWFALTGGWTSTGNCVTIPNTVPETAIAIQTQSVTGSCAASTTVNLVNKNIFAGNTQTKKLCLDKHQIEVYKNTPGGGSTIALINLDTNLFSGTGEIVPSGAMKVWSFISGPSIVPFTNTNTVDFKNAVIGSYVFRKTITYGSCTHSTDYTATVKFCTAGDQVTKVSTACKLNSVITMNTAYAALINSTYNPITTAGCWTYVGSPTGAQLNLEINGVPYTNYQTLDDFPYNATVKITSVGKYEFQFDTGNGGGSGGTNPGGCVPVLMETVCDCDFFASYNSSGSFVIDTNPGVPWIGSSKTYNIGCGTRQVSLLTKFTQLNTPFPAGESGIAGGGTWTLDFVSGSPGLPFTCLVNGVSTTFTTIGQTVPGGVDPLIDLTGLPNPSNYAFKYTVTGACGSNSKNLTVNINCNDCNKVINTVAPRTDCITTLSAVRPSIFTPNIANIVLLPNNISNVCQALARTTDCDGVTNDVLTTSRGMYQLNKTTASTNTMGPGDYLKTITLYSPAIGGTGRVTININPNTTPYLTNSCSTGCSGTVTATDLFLPSSTTGLGPWTNAITKVIKNAICTLYPGSTCNSNFTLVVTAGTSGGNINNTYVAITMGGKHQPVGHWFCLLDNNCVFTYSDNNVDKTSGNLTTGTWASSNGSLYMNKADACGSYFGTYLPTQDLSGNGYLNLTTSTMINYVLNTTTVPITLDPLSANQLTQTCSKWNFSTTVSPACSGAATYSYKVNGVAIPETTSTFVKKTKASENNPFNPCGTGSQPFETTVTCDGCTYVKTTMNFNC